MEQLVNSNVRPNLQGRSLDATEGRRSRVSANMELQCHSQGQSQMQQSSALKTEEMVIHL
jgi:hypothetical protein